jgi:Ca2+-dependent lipid-binding protein
VVETVFEGRRKGDKKVIGTVILRLVDAFDVRPAPAAKEGPEKSRSCSVRLQMDKHKELSKVKKKTLKPVFNEQYVFQMFQQSSAVLKQEQFIYVTLLDTVGKAVNSSTNTLGSGRLDLTKLTKDELHEVVVECRNEKSCMGKVRLSLTISGADTSAAKEAAYTKAKEKGTYSLMRSFGGNGLHDVGILKVTLHCANDLIKCDFGASDPYCYVDLGNQRFRTRTIYKSVNPEWERVFTLTSVSSIRIST